MKRLARFSALGLLGGAALLAGCSVPQAQVAPTPKVQAEQVAMKMQADPVAKNKAVMAKFLNLFETGKWQDFDQVIAKDCVLHHPGGSDLVGLGAMTADWKVFFAPLQDLKVTPKAEIGEGDLLIEFYMLEAHYKGDFMGKQVAGTPVKYNQVEMLRFVDGKIVEWWVEYDRLWMAQQLGFDLKPQ